MPQGPINGPPAQGADRFPQAAEGQGKSMDAAHTDFLGRAGYHNDPARPGAKAMGDLRSRRMGIEFILVHKSETAHGFQREVSG